MIPAHPPTSSQQIRPTVAILDIGLLAAAGSLSQGGRAAVRPTDWCPTVDWCPTWKEVKMTKSAYDEF